MMNRLLLVVALALSVAAGCKKAKPTSPDTAPPTAGPAAPPAGNPGGGGNNVGIIPGGGVGVVTNPGAVVGGGGGGGAAQAVRKAARRTQALNELHQLGLIIEDLRDPFGKMPTKEQIVASVKQTAPTIHKAIEEGSYILTGTTQGGGLWAYEVDADKQAGVALVGGRAVRTTPDEVQQHLKNN
jgi:hypothetical protein